MTKCKALPGSAVKGLNLIVANDRSDSKRQSVLSRGSTRIRPKTNDNSICLSAINASEDFYFALYKFTHIIKP